MKNFLKNLFAQKQAPIENMRLAIVKDALAQLNAHQVDPTSGVYCEFSFSLKANDNLQTKLKELPPCEACALGTLFLSNVRLNNDLFLKENEIYGIRCETVYNNLEKYFSSEELREIEAAFEGNTSNGRRYAGFKYEVPDASERLKLILENMVKNGGTFVSGEIEFNEDEYYDDDDDYEYYDDDYYDDDDDDYEDEDEYYDEEEDCA